MWADAQRFTGTGNTRLLVGKPTGLCQIGREALLLVAQVVGVDACRAQRPGQLAELPALAGNGLFQGASLGGGLTIGQLLGLGGALGADQFIGEGTQLVAHAVELALVLD
ncbi:hypothetical protein D9M68_303370 [compost metagenome]